MMTVSAAVRLIPRPPALVHSRNTNLSESEGRSGRVGGKDGGSQVGYKLHARPSYQAWRIGQWPPDEGYLSPDHLSFHRNTYTHGQQS